MRNVTIVDSTVWVDFFAGRSNPETKWLDSAMGHELIGVIDLILCEVLEGVREDRQFKEIKLQMLEFEFFATGSLEMAMASAENCRKLRARGFTVRKTIDCWIATFCLRSGYGLLHRDRDFETFEHELGLKVMRV